MTSSVIINLLYLPQHHLRRQRAISIRALFWSWLAHTRSFSPQYQQNAQTSQIPTGSLSVKVNNYLRDEVCFSMEK
jgi:hypothetical protein